MLLLCHLGTALGEPVWSRDEEEHGEDRQPPSHSQTASLRSPSLPGSEAAKRPGDRPPPPDDLEADTSLTLTESWLSICLGECDGDRLSRRGRGPCVGHHGGQGEGLMRKGRWECLWPRQQGHGEGSPLASH